MTTEVEPGNSAANDYVERGSVLRRHPWAFGIVGGAIAVVLVSGLTAWGVTALLEGAGTPVGAAAPMSPMTGATPAPAQPLAKAARGIRGTITAIDGSRWTIATKAGPAVTISVDSSTMYGTKAAPATVSDFAVGDSVAVIGTRTGDTALATRVLKTTGGAGTNPVPSVGPNS